MKYSADLALLPQNLTRISSEPKKLFKMFVKSFRRGLTVGATITFYIECKDFEMEMIFHIDRWDTLLNTEINGVVYLDKISTRDMKAGKHFYFEPSYDNSVPTAFESDDYLTDSKSLFFKMVQFTKGYDSKAYTLHFENAPEQKIRNTRDSGNGPSQLFRLVENVVYLRE